MVIIPFVTLDMPYLKTSILFNKKRWATVKFHHLSKVLITTIDILRTKID